MESDKIEILDDLCSRCFWYNHKEFCSNHKNGSYCSKFVQTNEDLKYAKADHIFYLD